MSYSLQYSQDLALNKGLHKYLLNEHINEQGLRTATAAIIMKQIVLGI